MKTTVALNAIFNVEALISYEICRLIVFFKKSNLQTSNGLSSLFLKAKQEWRYSLILLHYNELECN